MGGQCHSFYPHTVFVPLQQDVSDDNEDGYIYEVDLHYPTDLDDQHDDYPLAPESLVCIRPQNNQYSQNLHLRGNLHQI